MFDQAAKLIEPARVVVTVGIAVGIAGTLAQAVWSFAVSPDAGRPVPTAAVEEASAVAANIERIAGLHLFGRTVAGRVANAGLDRTPDTKLNLVLAAVFEASDPAASVAVIGTQGRPAEAYRIGDEIPGGARLAEVHADLVVISRGGVRETLRFDDLPFQTATADTGRAPAAPGSPESILQPGAPQDAPRYERQKETVRTVVDTSRERLQEDPKQTLSAIGLQPVSPSETRGYRVGSLADAPQLAHTGLQTGDVIVSVNGRPVGSAP